ncbi:TPA: hypothetical protein HH295_13000 [Xanthomonas vasicola pv. zeae]|uniref:Uncharacterized protein n=1 Tax=Xanthomonas vasicola pv. vasculorum TaxID=325776 RepID=A0AAE8F483_XANVA|nr:hypothetical protein C7V42_18015 [Xanthomonas vasicola pv. vasculorum]KFA37531.1 hypothetical protein KWI_0104705 [Xanthomonas vasicola pv. vasculorum NCPPB 206]TWQ18673.1 hypothetical protein FQK00_18245 [Xanthomonas vasicola]HHZ23991.1 hypothetical protein [Xanthomonas vasicola pv. zeae]AZM72411.1 hypothetical protein CXP37_18030 [Xanthomonas vasicola pv. vasculorum]
MRSCAAPAASGIDARTSVVRMVRHTASSPFTGVAHRFSDIARMQQLSQPHTCLVTAAHPA